MSKNPLPHLGFKRFEPSIKLCEFIECYWFISSEIHSPTHATEYLYPDGGMGIILNYADALQFEGRAHSPQYFLDGTNTLARAVGFYGTLNAVGIRFKPAGANQLFSIPLNELKNTALALSDTNIINYSSLYYKLSHAKTYFDKVAIIENWLCKSIQSKMLASEVVIQSMKLIKSHNGLIAIDSVAKSTGFNQRRIERLFNSQVGMTPKEYASNLRIKAARNQIKLNLNSSFTELAHKLGYHDQAHFIKQFKKIVGITPKQYLMKSLR